MFRYNKPNRYLPTWGAEAVMEACCARRCAAATLPLRSAAARASSEEVLPRLARLGGAPELMPP